MIARKLCALAVMLTCCLLAGGRFVHAQSAGYTTLNVKGRVGLEIPSDWAISDLEQRTRVKEFGEKFTGIPARHMAALSVQSYPAPSRVFARVSFIPLDPPLSQAEVREEVQANRQQVLHDLADVWREESPIMWVGLAKRGIKQVGQPSVDAQWFGGQLALIIQYARTSTVNPAETIKVTQYHVPLGPEKALITLSYVDGDQVAMAAHERLKSSFAIR